MCGRGKSRPTTCPWSLNWQSTRNSRGRPRQGFTRLTTGTDTSAAADYRVYTRSFDRVVTSAELDSVLGRLPPSQHAALEDAWAAFQTGLLAWRTKAHLKALD